MANYSAFGAREDVTLQIHACLLALATGKPVRIVYGREESFYGHVHRHPARLWYAHGATREGDLVFVRATIVLDGGGYASSSPAVVANAACFGAGPYRVPNAVIHAVGAYTNDPPTGAMRGFGAVQSCFAYEAQMDRLAAALAMDPVALIFGSVGVSANAPHPNAARLLANFVLSREGQTLLTKHGRLPTRLDTPSNPPDATETLLKQKVIGAVLSAAEQKKWAAEFNTLFKKK